MPRNTPTADDPPPPEALARHRAMIDRAREQVAALSAGAAPGDGCGSGAPTDDRPPADLIDGYDLLDEIHRGGQGVVYRAVQRSTGRRVAVKVLMHGAFASASERRRFEREVDVLARLDAPGIVRIVDSGVSSGRWWFAMDLIAGVPLDRVPRERRSLVALLATVADAVHAAHLRGVIHRDLKPANILVDERGQPHVLDFGLARWEPHGAVGAPDADGTIPSETGRFIGSLPWASPEQVIGDPSAVDLRSDIYSLGVILYQLLTDRFPTRVVGPLHAITRAIAEEHPTPPAELDPSIDRELEMILLTSLRKEPARRYQSAAALAQDLRSYLNGEPIAARRDSLGALLRLWIRRHAVAASLAVTCLALLLAGSIGTTLLWRHAAAARTRAESEARTSAAVLRFLERAIGSADPGQAGGSPMSMVAWFEQAERELDAHAGREDPQVEAAMRHSVAHALRQLGRFEEASRLAESGLALRERTLPEPHVETGRSLILLATIRRDQGRAAEAQRLAERGLAVIRAAHGDRDHEDIAAAMLELAWARNRPGAGDASESLLREAIAMLERLVPEEDERLLTARLNLMVLAHGSTTLPECAALVNRIRAALGPRHHASIAGLKMLAAMQSIAGEPTAAAASLDEALDATRAVYGRAHPLTIDTLVTRAELAARQGEIAAGYRLLTEQAASARDAYGAPGSSTIGWARFQSVAGSLATSLDAEDAERWLQGALETYATLPVAEHDEAARVRVALAVLFYRRGRPDEADRMARDCLAMPNDLLPAEHWTRAQATALAGRIALDQGRFAEAEPLLLAADEALRREPARNAPVIAGTVRALADLYEAWQRTEPDERRAAALLRWRAAAGR